MKIKGKVNVSTLPVRILKMAFLLSILSNWFDGPKISRRKARKLKITASSVKAMLALNRSTAE